MENRRNILLKKQKEKMNKSKDFNCNKTEIKSKEKIKSHGTNIKFNKTSNTKSNNKQKTANTESKKIEEQVKNNNEIGENLKAGDDKDKDNDNDKMKLEENANNENNENINKDNIVANEEQNQNQIQKEESLY